MVAVSSVFEVKPYNMLYLTKDIARRIKIARIDLILRTMGKRKGNAIIRFENTPKEGSANCFDFAEPSQADRPDPSM